MIKIARHVLFHVFSLLLAWAPLSKASCSVGATVLETCRGVGEATKLRLYVEPTCNFIIIAKWGETSVGSTANSTQLSEVFETGDRRGRLVGFPIEFEYTSPGDYSIGTVVRGYSNSTFLDEDRLIEVKRDEVVRLGIREDSCEVLPDSGLDTWAFGLSLALAALSSLGLLCK